MATAQQIIADIEAHIRKSGHAYREWYAGVTSDIEERLFRAHGVSRENHWWIHRETTSSDIARNVEAYLLRQGCQGGGGGGDNSSRWVYAYVITSQTRE
jgi:hypothetical protein